MLIGNSREKVAQLLAKTAEALDIPDYVYEAAVLKYEGVGEWLASDDSEIREYAPEVYPQGSFRLGTVIQPISGYDYDIDLVCVLKRTKEQTTQALLKQMIGDRLKKNPDLAGQVSPGCRCWLIDYPKEASLPAFHMDVLPSIPNTERLPTGILLTDRDLVAWQKSNPKAYAEWFYGRMKTILLEKRAALAKASQLKPEDVPEWAVKTPLQVAVQILKRHRDIHFSSSPDDRPISIIITTLAAWAYGNQASVYEALLQILQDMPKFIQLRDNRWWIPNPTEPHENFADRWNQYPERREHFASWLAKAYRDISQLDRGQRLDEAAESLGAPLGRNLMQKVARNLGLQGPPPVVASPNSVPGLGNDSHRNALLWPLRVTHTATVTGSVHYRKGSRRLWDLASRPVPKNVWLKFSLQTDVPPPYTISWQVVNTGKEAEEAGQLRGEFYDSDSGNVRWESTRFRGTHWVEGLVIKNGACAARSGRVMVKIR